MVMIFQIIAEIYKEYGTMDDYEELLFRRMNVDIKGADGSRSQSHIG